VGGSLFRLETSEGVPADPSTLENIVPSWRPGDSIYLGHRELRVVGIRDDDADQPPVLIVGRSGPGVEIARVPNRVGLDHRARPPER
jgi:hypothetical protein